MYICVCAYLCRDTNWNKMKWLVTDTEQMYNEWNISDYNSESFLSCKYNFFPLNHGWLLPSQKDLYHTISEIYGNVQGTETCRERKIPFPRGMNQISPKILPFCEAARTSWVAQLLCMTDHPRYEEARGWTLPLQRLCAVHTRSLSLQH